MVCRCEGISAGDCAHRLRADFGPAEVNRLKAITRCGMGRCQGRFCALAGAELTAHDAGVPLEAVGRLRAQPPVKPLPLAVILRKVLRPQRAMKPVHRGDGARHAVPRVPRMSGRPRRSPAPRGRPVRAVALNLAQVRHRRSTRYTQILTPGANSTKFFQLLNRKVRRKIRLGGAPWVRRVFETDRSNNRPF
jgi:hypothetical protein